MLKKLFSLLAIGLLVAQTVSISPVSAAGSVLVNIKDKGYSESNGLWKDSGVKGYEGRATRYIYSPNPEYAMWTPELESGKYKVMFYKLANVGGHKKVKIEVKNADGVFQTVIDSTKGDSAFITLGTFNFNKGNSGYVKMSKEGTGIIRSSVVMFEPDPNSPVTSNQSTQISAQPEKPANVSPQEATATNNGIVINVKGKGYAESNGLWKDSGIKGYEGKGTRYISSPDPEYAMWTPELVESGKYKVMFYKVANVGGHKKVKIEVNHADGVFQKVIDSTKGDSAFITLGTFNFNKGNSGYVKMSKEGAGIIRSSAVVFERDDAVSNSEGSDVKPNTVDNQISVKINGVLQKYDQMPVIKNGRTMVPMRAIFEMLGAAIKWDAETQTVTANKGSIVVKIAIGKQTVYINDKEQKLDQPAEIINSRTMVPARFVAEALGAKVDWDEKTKTVLIVN